MQVIGSMDPSRTSKEGQGSVLATIPFHNLHKRPSKKFKDNTIVNVYVNNVTIARNKDVIITSLQAKVD